MRVNVSLVFQFVEAGWSPWSDFNADNNRWDFYCENTCLVTTNTRMCDLGIVSIAGWGPWGLNTLRWSGPLPAAFHYNLPHEMHLRSALSLLFIEFDLRVRSVHYLHRRCCVSVTEPMHINIYQYKYDLVLSAVHVTCASCGWTVINIIGEAAAFRCCF